MRQDEQVFRKYMCLLCGYVYDEEKGWEEDGIASRARGKGRIVDAEGWRQSQGLA